MSQMPDSYILPILLILSILGYALYKFTTFLKEKIGEFCRNWRTYLWYNDDTRVLFFPDETYPCNTFYKYLKEGKSRKCYNKNYCSYSHKTDEEWTSFMKLLDVLNEARSHIDICVYLFTQQFLFEFIVFLYKERKLRVRIITDSSDDETKKNMNKIGELQAAGIKVKTSSAKMHHKFVIIDNKKLIHGSFNWTRNAILENHESLIITTNPKTVHEFSKQFIKMWSKFHLVPY